LRQEYLKEHGNTKRRDAEEEWEFQDRVARLCLQASCPDWDRLDELGCALVNDFNRFCDSRDAGALF
jgi:hypothetical protein